MEHYFSKKPNSDVKELILELSINSIHLKLITSSSVFSRKKLDKGTELLIKESIIPKDARVLDLGCGYGPVGIAIAKLYPTTKIVMSDINERAVSLAKRNSKINSEKIEVIQSNIYDNINGNFDTILSNPPQSAGKDVCFEIIEESIPHLKKGGTLQLVVRKSKGGKQLSNKMQEVFGNVETVGIKSGFHIYLSKNV